MEKQKSEAKRATQKLKAQLYESQRIERQLLLEIRRARSGTSVIKQEEIKKNIELVWKLEALGKWPSENGFSHPKNTRKAY